MKLNNKLKHIILGVAAGAMSLSAYAAFGLSVVYDPTNWAQNNTTALNSVKTEITTAKALIQQTQTAIAAARSIKGIADMAGLAQVTEALSLYKDLKAVDSRLEQDFRQSADLTERVTSKYGASDMSWQEYMNSSSQIEKQQRDTSAQRYSAINASIEQTSRQRQAIVSKLGAVQGQTEAMQTLGAAIDVLIGQNQQIISILAANNKVAETKQDLATGKAAKTDQEAAKLMNAYQQRMREAANKY